MSTDAYQPATTKSSCPDCGSDLNTNRYYPGEGNRYYCPPCDIEWWTDEDGIPL